MSSACTPSCLILFCRLAREGGDQYGELAGRSVREEGLLKSQENRYVHSDLQQDFMAYVWKQVPSLLLLYIACGVVLNKSD